MKKIRVKIALTMISSVCVIFIVFILAFVFSFNSYFENQAVERLKQEQEYNKFSSISTDYIEINGEGELSDDGSEYTYIVENYFPDENLFYDTIQYIFTDGNYKPIDVDDNYALKKEKDKILNACILNKDRLYSGDTIQINDDTSHYIIAQNYSEYAFGENEKETVINVMYIDIRPIENLSYKFISISVVVLILIAILMYFIGMLLGRRIENEQAQQTTFFQNASHELKTPLMSIQGYAEGILTDVIEPKKAVQVILNESERMNELVEELLCLSKLESSNIRMKKEPVDIKELLYDCLRSVEAVLDKNGIMPVVEFEEGIIIISGDEGQLRKAFLNLISNAVRYAKDEIKIQCSTEKNSVHIKVTDNGNGIDTDTVSHIFERFYTGKNGNTGIGLALTKEIIKHHNGQISAENTSNGACFSVTIPRKSK